MRRGKPKDKRTAQRMELQIGILLANGLHSDYPIAGKKGQVRMALS